MGFVDNHQRLLRQIIDQGRWRLACGTPGQGPRVILDAFAKTDLVQHFQIEPSTLFDTLRFQQFAFADELIDPFTQFLLDEFDGAQCRIARCDVMARRINREARQAPLDLAGERIEQIQAIHFVVEQTDTQGRLRVLRWKHVEHVAAHSKRAAFKFQFVALILHLRQALDDVALHDFFFLAYVQNHAVIVGRIADTVDTRYRRDDHRIVALEQGFCRRQTHLLDVFVDAGIFFDIEIARGNVGFRLVIIVIGNKIFHRVFR